MQWRLNRGRAGLTCALAGILWLWWRKPYWARLPHMPDISLSLNRLDQTHTIAAYAVILIAVVGIVKLLKR